jgi:hypothetical protein
MEAELGTLTTDIMILMLMETREMDTPTTLLK